jgi:hypothetical protein
MVAILSRSEEPGKDALYRGSRYRCGLLMRVIA